MDTTLITTSTTLEGYKVVKQLGLVRGITVRSRSVFGNFAGGIQSISPAIVGRPTNNILFHTILA